MFFFRLIAFVRGSSVALWVVLGMAMMNPLWAFVTMDTSVPNSVKTSLPAQQPSVADSSLADSLPLLAPPKTDEPIVSPSQLMPRFPVVLFLSSDDYEVYAALGVMAAMQKYGLQPSAIIGESRAAVIAAGMALGYSASQLEKTLLAQPADGWVLPFSHSENRKAANSFSQPESQTFVWTLAGQSLQSDQNLWLNGSYHETPEYLHLAWMIAQLVHGAPHGSIAHIQDSPIPLALQMYDAETGKLRTVSQGDFQDLLKACLFPPMVARDRPSVRPFSDGAQVSSHDINLTQLPFQFDRLIALKLSPHLGRRMFGGEAPNWRDSVNHGFHENQRFRLDSLANVGKVDFIDIQPDPQGLPATSPAMWRDLGYQAALRHMDLLIQSMQSTARPPAANEKKDHPPTQISIDPLASGGRELLLDLLQQYPLNDTWASGSQTMNAVMGTGFYSQLDVAWQPESPTAGEQWVFTAKEQSKVQVWMAPHMVFTPEALSLRAPELMAGFSWSEPLFIPIKFEVIGDIGGRQPGWAFQAFAQPVSPVSLRTGIRHVQTDLNHIDPDRLNFDNNGDRFGASNFRMREKTSGLFLDLWPDDILTMGGQLNMRYLRFGLMNDDVDSLRSQLEGKAAICLGCKPLFQHAFHPGLSLSYRGAETVSEGSVKPTQQTYGARLWFDLPFSKGILERVWSNYSKQEVDVYDLYTGPQVDALSFADQFFFLSAKALRFVHARGEFLPQVGSLQGRAAFGWIHHEGDNLLIRANQNTQTYWEVDISYPTPLGPIRLGMGQLDQYDPLYIAQFGVNLNLWHALEKSRL